MTDDKPTQEQIDEVLNKISVQADKGGSKWPGMTYEQGVEAALMWITGVWEDNPIDD